MQYPENGLQHGREVKGMPRPILKNYDLLVLYWTGTWWSRVNDERVKEGKRLIFIPWVTLPAFVLQGISQK